jgi:hypothetical protein
MQIKQYTDNPIFILKKEFPIFLGSYYLSVLITYFGTILFGWYFVYLAYTVEVPSYDILCSQCKPGYHLFTLTLIILWMFNFYFYLLNEIRFRFWNYIREKFQDKIKRSNLYLITLTIVLTIMTLSNFIKLN